MTNLERICAENLSGSSVQLCSLQLMKLRTCGGREQLRCPTLSPTRNKQLKSFAHTQRPLQLDNESTTRRSSGLTEIDSANKTSSWYSVFIISCAVCAVCLLVRQSVWWVSTCRTVPSKGNLVVVVVPNRENERQSLGLPRDRVTAPVHCKRRVSIQNCSCFVENISLQYSTPVVIHLVDVAIISPTADNKDDAVRSLTDDAVEFVFSSVSVSERCHSFRLRLCSRILLCVLRARELKCQHVHTNGHLCTPPFAIHRHSLCLRLPLDGSLTLPLSRVVILRLFPPNASSCSAP